MTAPSRNDRHRLLVCGLLLLGLPSAPSLVAQHFHRLPATPETVAWVGDGHAAQGDGEVDQTAIETSLRGRLQLTVRKDLHLAWPRAETSTHFIAMGMDKDLTKATQIAVQQAIDFVAAYRGWSKMEAYRLVSVACDVRVTELVDGNVGVHVMIPKAILGAAR